MLKRYQAEAAARFRRFLLALGEVSITESFLRHQDRASKRADYFPVAGLEDVPFVCLKIPTGGGKTLTAAACVPQYAAATATERPVVLWLTPSATVRDQTLAAIRRPGLLRDAIGQGLSEPTILSMAEALETGRAPYEGGPVVIVTTFQALKRDERSKEGLKFYSANGYVMDAFENLTPEQRSGLETDGGMIVPSLANLLRMKRPMIITDEAHDARTPLAFETYARLAPTAILELTATPKGTERGANKPPPSNVLVDVRAAELKADGMVKLPLRLDVREVWTAALDAAVTRRGELEATAEAHDVPTKPILLVQCEPKGGRLDLAEVKARLEQMGIAPDEVFDGTGGATVPRDLESPKNPIRTVLTVQQLAQGWDCPSAYVLCGLRDYGKLTPVVQLLGRIMRQPRATPTGIEDLDRAYVYVPAQSGRATASIVASGLADAMAEIGYQPDEARRMIEAEQKPLEFADVPATGLFAREFQAASVRIAVPQLTLDLGDGREIASADMFLPSDLQFSTLPAELPEYDPDAKADAALLDVRGESLRVSAVAQVAAQNAMFGGEGIEARDIARWLDRNIRHNTVSQRESVKWMVRVVDGLVRRGVTPARLWGDRLRLRSTVEARMRDLLSDAAKHAAEGYLIDPAHLELRTSAEPRFLHTFPAAYVPRRADDREYDWQKHAYGVVGEMNQEEFYFAQLLDGRDEVEAWVRNNVRQPGSFRLPTSTDYFYPDFVAQLCDGRQAAFEYKGLDRFDHPHEQEKLKIGELWAERSDGRCVFAMPTKADYRSSVKAAVAARLR